MRRLGIALMLVILAGCGSVDDIARQLAARAGRQASAADDIALRLRALASTEDDALRLGQGILGSAPSRATAEARVGRWIDDALSGLPPERRQELRSFALSATCDALDAAVQGQLPDLGSMVVAGLASGSEAVDQQLLRRQLNDMFADLQSGSSETFAARIEVLSACLIATR